MRLLQTALLAMLAIAPTAAPAKDGPTSLDLYAFFVGRSHGEGRFVSKLTGSDRHFTVAAHGRIEDGDLVLVEKVVYDDGVKDTAVWRFTRSGMGYTGRRTGVETLVPVKTEGGRVTMSYVASVPGTDGTPVKLRFADVLQLENDGTVLNTAKVSWLGIPVGKVEVRFHRE